MVKLSIIVDVDIRVMIVFGIKFIYFGIFRNMKYFILVSLLIIVVI